MNVKSADFHIARCDDTFNVSQLVNRNSEFRIDVSGLNVSVSAGGDMWIESDAARCFVAVLMSELFEDGNVVDVDDEAEFDG